MISTPLSRIDPTLLYGPFFDRVAAMLHDLEGRGISYFAVSGFRSYPEQQALYDQGRTTTGAKVTQAKPGESAHNFGIAVDFVCDGYLDRAGLQPDYRPESYGELGATALKHGLTWGGTWRFPDRPHVQLPGFVSAVELAPLRAVFEQSGLLAVFAHLNQIHQGATYA